VQVELLTWQEAVEKKRKDVQPWFPRKGKRSCLTVGEEKIGGGGRKGDRFLLQGKGQILPSGKGGLSRRLRGRGKQRLFDLCMGEREERLRLSWSRPSNTSKRKEEKAVRQIKISKKGVSAEEKEGSN